MSKLQYIDGLYDSIQAVYDKKCAKQYLLEKRIKKLEDKVKEVQLKIVENNIRGTSIIRLGNGTYQPTDAELERFRTMMTDATLTLLHREVAFSVGDTIV